MIHFTADWHLFHGNIIKYSGRTDFMEPYQRELLLAKPRKEFGYSKEDVQDIRITNDAIDRMTERLLNRINACVGPQDDLFVLGDLCWHAEKNQGRLIHFLSGIECRNLHIVWGNHDRDGDWQPNKLLRQALLNSNNVRDIQDEYVLRTEAQTFHLSHFPMARWQASHYGSINLYGHCHGGYEGHRVHPDRQLDVGIDNAHRLGFGYSPLSLPQVMTLLKQQSQTPHL